MASSRARRAIGTVVAACLLALCAYASLRAMYWLYPFPYRQAVLGAAQSSGLDPRLVLAVARTESRFDPDARSRDGAVGLMQIQPATATWVAQQRGRSGPGPADLYVPADNLAAGSWYLAYLETRFGGRLAPAVAAYNAGSTPVQLWLRQGIWDGRPASAGQIPFPETRLFVQRVLGAYAVYRLLYPGQQT